MSGADSAAARRTETIPEWKREEVQELAAFVERYDSVGVVGVAGIPSRQLQQMRRDLHGTAALRMSRNTLAVRALEAADEELEQLAAEVTGQVGLVGTDANPFSLYQRLEESKTPAPIGAGEVAPNDIVIPEGDTGIDPGPFVGELQTVGADARIEDGSIKVLSDSTVLEAGEEVSADLANVLNELGIEPKEVGLDLRAVHSEGVLFGPEELDVDVAQYRADVEAAGAAARNLSVNAAYPTARTTGTLLGTARGEAMALALGAAVEDPDVVPDLVARADAQVRALAGLIDDGDALPEELRGATPEPPAGTEVAEGADEGGAEQGGADAEDGSEGQDAGTDADGDADDDDDDDGDAGAEGLGEMFG